MPQKVLINLATGLEDSERVTVAFLVAGAAEGGGVLLACPFCVNTRQLEPDDFVPNARVAGATPMWEWLGDEAGTVFSY